MDPNEALSAIAQVAIGILGFTAVVAVLGRRSRGDWNKDELIAFRILLETSATALFISFLPGLLGMTVASLDTVWRMSNAVLGAIHLTFFAAFLWRVRGSPAEPTFGQRLLSLSAVGIIVAHFLTAAGAIPWAALIFIVGLLQQLYVAVHNFVLLLFPVSPLQDDGGAA
jgi:hypothetical protein